MLIGPISGGRKSVGERGGGLAYIGKAELLTGMKVGSRDKSFKPTSAFFRRGHAGKKEGKKKHGTSESNMVRGKPQKNDTCHKKDSIIFGKKRGGEIKRDERKRVPYHPGPVVAVTSGILIIQR